MKHISKTEKDALGIAKADCIAQFEESNDINLTSEDDKVVTETNDNWLVKSGSCQCNCGETYAIDVTLFEDDIKLGISGIDYPFNIDEVRNGKLYNAVIGVCDYCGE